MSYTFATLEGVFSTGDQRSISRDVEASFSAPVHTPINPPVVAFQYPPSDLHWALVGTGVGSKNGRMGWAVKKEVKWPWVITGNVGGVRKHRDEEKRTNRTVLNDEPKNKIELEPGKYWAKILPTDKW